MTTERYNQVFNDGSELSQEEYKEGWHFCMTEWNGLLIGPGMPEYRYCSCEPPDLSFLDHPGPDTLP